MCVRDSACVSEIVCVSEREREESIPEKLSRRDGGEGAHGLCRDALRQSHGSQCCRREGETEVSLSPGIYLF